jgi:hypothetical protein
MSVALACLVVISASLLSSLLRDARAIQQHRNRNAREMFHVHLTIDRSQLGEPPSHR